MYALHMRPDDPARAALETLVIEGMGDALTELAPSSRQHVVSRIAELLERAIDGERARCAGIARGRAELWRGTSLATAALAFAREEARARANEAIVIADLIEGDANEEAVDGEDEVN